MEDAMFEELEDIVRQKLQLKLMQEMYGGQHNAGKTADEIMQSDRQVMKVFKQELKMLVATEDDKESAASCNSLPIIPFLVEDAS